MRIRYWSSDVCSSDLLHGVEPLAGLVRRRPVRKVPARRERHAHDRIAGLEQCHIDGGIRLRAGMRLHVGVAAAEQRLRPVDGERSEERRVGKECVSTCRSWWSPVHSKKKKIVM